MGNCCRRYGVRSDRAGGFDVVRLNQVRLDGRVKQLLDRTATGWGKLKLRETKFHASASRTPGLVARRGSRTLKKKARNNFTRGRRDPRRTEGDAEVRIVTADDPQAEAVLDRVLALKRHWLEENEPGSPFLGREGDSLRAVLISSFACRFRPDISADVRWYSSPPRRSTSSTKRDCKHT